MGPLRSVGALGALYLAGRVAGKLAGAWLGSRMSPMPLQMTLTIGERFPSLAPTVNTVVLASVVIFEIIGPLSAGIVLGKSGEIRSQPPLQDPSF